MIEKNAGRICSNCGAVYKEKNVTICKKCGHVTGPKVVTKGVKNETPLGE